MEATNEFEEAVAGHRVKVEFADIETALAGLWKQASHPASGSKLPAATRACVATLAIYAPAGDDTAALDAAIAGITARHPCRVLVLKTDPQAPESGLETLISAHCHSLSGSTTQICCEQVVVSARSEATDALPNALRSLLVPDLPVFLWCRDETPFSLPHIGRLMETVDRLLVDTASWDAPQEMLPQLAALAGARDTALGDLNWARLFHWRQLTAQFFDGPVGTGLLPRLEKAVIEYRMDSQHPDRPSCRALMLGGWLAGRLGWKLESARAIDGGCRYAFTSDNGARHVELRPVAADPESPRHLVSFRVEAGDAGRHTVAATDSPTVLTTCAEAPSQPRMERTVHCSVPDDSGLVGYELERAGRHLVYEEALAMAADLARRWVAG